jgi:hydrophobic/amphiphilic exporter-1 (mainly G- bacteria), HAE1 family
MSALFENFFYPFIIMFSVPLAAAGGFVGLFMVNVLIMEQPLDILTMLGFVISWWESWSIMRFLLCISL